MNETYHILKCNECFSAIGTVSIVYNGTNHIMGIIPKCPECLDKLDLDMQGFTRKQKDMIEEVLAIWKG